MKTPRFDELVSMFAHARLSRRAAIGGGAGLAAVGPLGRDHIAAQEGTPPPRGVVIEGHPLIGSWLVYETNPPAGGSPVLTAVATFTGEGSALVSGFGSDGALQGLWIEEGSHQATLTAVGLSGGIGELHRLRASIEVATDNGPFRGTYSFDVVGADGNVVFTYSGPIEGRRVEVQAPDLPL